MALIVALAIVAQPQGGGRAQEKVSNMDDWSLEPGPKDHEGQLGDSRDSKARPKMHVEAKRGHNHPSA